ncbi:hypothetical protein JXO52_06450 [bacterium]|nr:hypothetical protein [bacterium]
MTKDENADTRYFIDLDLASGRILRWDYGQRQVLVHEERAKPSHHRIFLTRGQYNKLEKKSSDLKHRETGQC